MRTLFWASGGFALVLLAYCAWPLVGVAELAAAGARGDPVAVMHRVDLPALRKSLARQIVAAYLRQNGKYQKLGPYGRDLAAGLGTSVADSLLADMLTPKNITSMLEQGRVAPSVAGEPLQLPRLSELLRSDPLRVLANSYFDGVISYVALVGDSEGYGIHLHLRGITWRLSGVDFPAELLDRLAREAAARDKRPG